MESNKNLDFNKFEKHPNIKVKIFVNSAGRIKVNLLILINNKYINTNKRELSNSKRKLEKIKTENNKETKKLKLDLVENSTKPKNDLDEETKEGAEFLLCLSKSTETYFENERV